ncbi:MAG: response regulator receiver modulated diguanylate cyclase [Myxococcales bacterium]|nr:response regulator receiver modulated diguanylate cyclase [Myxococcales bacterium]
MSRRRLHSITRLWLLATVAIVSVAIGSGFVGRRQLRRLLVSIEVEERQTAELRVAVETRLTGMLNREVGLRGYLATGDAAFLAPYDAGGSSAEAAETLLAADEVDRDEIAAALRAERIAAHRWNSEIAGPQIAVRARRPYSAAELTAALEVGKRQFDDYRAVHGNLRNAFERARLTRARNRRDQVARAQVGTGALAVLLALFTAAVSRSMLRSVVRPLVALSKAAERGTISSDDIGSSSLREVVLLADTIAGLFRAVEERAMRDGLTRVYNRGYLSEWLPRQLRLSRRSGKPLSALMVDVDHFKRINDNHGHDAGDKVLVALARCIERELRSTDVVVRYGGEEFTVLLPDTPAAGGAVSGERLRAAVAAMGEREGLPAGIRITASIGVASVDGSDDGAQLLLRADAALYDAKRGGRNRVVLAKRAAAAAAVPAPAVDAVQWPIEVPATLSA